MTQELLGKDELLLKIEQGWDEFNAFLDQLSEEQLTAPTDDAGWNGKDHLTHLAVWEDGITALLTRQSRREQMGVDEETWNYTWETHEFDRINGLIQQQHKDMPLANVRAMHQAAHARLVAQIRAMSPDELMRPYRDFQPDSTSEAPVTITIQADTYLHYAEHRPWIAAIAAG